MYHLCTTIVQRLIETGPIDKVSHLPYSILDKQVAHNGTLYLYRSNTEQTLMKKLCNLNM